MDLVFIWCMIVFEWEGFKGSNPSGTTQVYTHTHTHTHTHTSSSIWKWHVKGTQTLSYHGKHAETSLKIEWDYTALRKWKWVSFPPVNQHRFDLKPSIFNSYLTHAGKCQADSECFSRAYIHN